jgi:hypothetical protein
MPPTGRGGTWSSGRGRGTHQSVQPANGPGLSGEQLAWPNEHSILPQTLDSKLHINQALTEFLNTWNALNTFFRFLLKLVGFNVLEYLHSLLEEAKKKNSSAVKKMTIWLVSLLVSGSALYYAHGKRSKILEWLMSNAMTRVKIADDSLNVNVRKWVQTEPTLLWKDKIVTAERSGKHSQDEYSTKEQLTFRPLSTWQIFFRNWNLFILKNDDETKTTEAQQPQDDNYDSQSPSWDNNANDGSGGRGWGQDLDDGRSRSASHPDFDPQIHPPLSLWCLWNSTAPQKRLLKAIEEKNADNSVVTHRAYVDPSTSQGHWKALGSVPGRSLDSIYLDPAIKNRFIKDLDFFTNNAAREFYTQRGIPFRRGYLLYGRPGCGRTSCARAVATKYKLHLYALSFLTPGLTDTIIEDLFKELKQGCLLLLEDVNSAGLMLERDFKKAKEPNADVSKTGGAVLDERIRPPRLWDEKENESASDTSSDSSDSDSSTEIKKVKKLLRKMKKKRSKKRARKSNKPAESQDDADTDSNANEASKAPSRSNGRASLQSTNAGHEEKPTGPPPARDTLSGLLNAIDGATSGSGYILMMTTNHKEALDPALIRAGRVDLRLEFGLATAAQAKELFINMYEQPAKKKHDDGTENKSEVPPYDLDKLPQLAQLFADSTPSGVLSCAQLQQFVLMHQLDPEAAANGIKDWAAQEVREENIKMDAVRVPRGGYCVRYNYDDETDFPELKSTATDKERDSTESWLAALRGEDVAVSEDDVNKALCVDDNADNICNPETTSKPSSRSSFVSAKQVQFNTPDKQTQPPKAEPVSVSREADEAATTADIAMKPMDPDDLTSSTRTNSTTNSLTEHTSFKPATLTSVSAAFSTVGIVEADTVLATHSKSATETSLKLVKDMLVSQLTARVSCATTID